MKKKICENSECNHYKEIYSNKLEYCQSCGKELNEIEKESRIKKQYIITPLAIVSIVGILLYLVPYPKPNYELVSLKVYFSTISIISLIVLILMGFSDWDNGSWLLELDLIIIMIITFIFFVMIPICGDDSLNFWFIFQLFIIIFGSLGVLGIWGESW